MGVRWSTTVLDELRRTMLHLGATEQQVDRRLGAMTESFPFATVEDYHELERGLTNDPKDRHVLAAAIRSECHTIVTFNLKHFPEASLRWWGIEALHPDEFLLNQLDLAPGTVLGALQCQSQQYTRPPMTIEDVLGRLARCGVPDFADECRRHLPPRQLGLPPHK